jgi:hypothetical protein
MKRKVFEGYKVLQNNGGRAEHGILALVSTPIISYPARRNGASNGEGTLTDLSALTST